MTNRDLCTILIRHWLRTVLLTVSLWVVTPLNHAEQALPEDEVSADLQEVEFDITIEVKGLETALTRATDALDRVASSLEDVVQHPELADEHQAKIAESLDSVVALTHEFNDMMHKVPSTIEKTGEPFLVAFERFSWEVKIWIILSSIALVLVVAAAFFCVYFFILSPSSNTILETSRSIMTLSANLQQTAELVDRMSETNREMLLRIEQIERNRESPDKN